jgi:hypothetical protein
MLTGRNGSLLDDGLDVDFPDLIPGLSDDDPDYEPWPS